jgi:[NiFe] hydrogenase diaphorase moiety small subunit
MTDLTFKIDGAEVTAKAGQTIMAACDEAGIYIPRLCDVQGLVPEGSCRLCVVKVNGRIRAACSDPVEAGAMIENEIPEIQEYRKDLVRMLFHEGNHLCPICEASGRCELQALAYRLGIVEPTAYPYLQPVRPLDASHPDIALDTNRCIFCGRCVRASRDEDEKGLFDYVGRGIHKRIGVNADCLSQTSADIRDAAMAPGLCPVGCVIRKREGFFAPVGERQYDQQPIGADIDKKRIPVLTIDPVTGAVTRNP